MFKKRGTPGSSKSTSPIPMDFLDNTDRDGDNTTIDGEEYPINPGKYSDNDHAYGDPNACMDPSHNDLSGDTLKNPTIQMQFTQKHPLGQILIKLLHENTKLAEKCNLKDMEMSVEELSKNFYNAQLMDKQRMKTKILQTTADLENALVAKEMNSHIINQSIAPPQHFNPTATFYNARQRADCMKLLPSGSNKFSGSEKGSSVLEFLHLLKSVQKQCMLSLPEFYEVMLASNTGPAYLLLHAWIEGGDDPETIFHNLLLHFDKRLQPEDARIKLMSYKAPRNSDLAKVEAAIQSLASRAASNIPAGPSRTANYNMEVIQGLIRSLPTTSSLIVQNQNSEKSARLGRSLTAAELSRFLNIHRHAIDKDIKQNGIDPREGFSKRQPFRAGNSGAKRNTIYGVRTNGTAPFHRKPQMGKDSLSPRYGQVSQVSQFRRNTPGGNKSFGNYQNNNNNSTMRRAWDDKHGIRNGRVPNRNSDGKFSNYKRKPFNLKTANDYSRGYCSLCGKKDHRAADGCPNMKNDNGSVVTIMPCKDTCNACPNNIPVRLAHPEYICPYRKAGPWGKA